MSRVPRDALKIWWTSDDAQRNYQVMFISFFLGDGHLPIKKRELFVQLILIVVYNVQEYKKNFVKELSRIVGESNYKGLLETETDAVEIFCFLRCKIFHEEKHVKLVSYVF